MQMPCYRITFADGARIVVAPEAEGPLDVPEIIRACKEDGRIANPVPGLFFDASGVEEVEVFGRLQDALALSHPETA